MTGDRHDLQVPVVSAGAFVALDAIPGTTLTFICVTKGAGILSVHALTDKMLPVGTLKWAGGPTFAERLDPDNLDDPGDPCGMVLAFRVDPNYRRRGIGTFLWKVAGELANTHGWVAPRHNVHRTGSGDAFARSVGGVVPELEDGEFGEAGDDGFRL